MCVENAASVGKQRLAISRRDQSAPVPAQQRPAELRLGRLIFQLTADWLRFRRSAAVVALPVSTTVRKVRRVSIDRRWFGALISTDP